MKKISRGGDPKAIASLLQKYRELKTPNKSIVRTFCSVVVEELGIPLKTDEVTYNATTKTLRINALGPKKSEILLCKNDVLKKCREELGEKNTPTNVF